MSRFGHTIKPRDDTEFFSQEKNKNFVCHCSSSVAELCPLEVFTDFSIRTSIHTCTWKIGVEGKVKHIRMLAKGVSQQIDGHKWLKLASFFFKNSFSHSQSHTPNSIDTTHYYSINRLTVSLSPFCLDWRGPNSPSNPPQQNGI